jgi:hypothetical protein
MNQPMRPAMIIGNYTTDDCKRRLEQCARQNGYHIIEWLIPKPREGASDWLRVIASMKINGKDHEFGFNWDGEDLNILASRCMALDMTMSQLPAMVARGEVRPHGEKVH